MEQWTGSKLGKEYIKAVYCHPAYLTSMESALCERSIFIPIPKKGNAKEYSNYHAIAVLSQASKLMLKILQARFQQ